LSEKSGMGLRLAHEHVWQRRRKMETETETGYPETTVRTLSTQSLPSQRHPLLAVMFLGPCARLLLFLLLFLLLLPQTLV